MRSTLRFLGALVLGFALVAATVGLGLALLLGDDPELKGALLAALQARPGVPLFVAALFLAVLAVLLYPLFTGYLAAMRALGQEGDILLANPSHRVSLRGPWELQQLADLINRLAAEKELLARQVEEKVAEAKALVEAERERLASLLAYLPQGVVLLDARGLVLLYNPSAREFLGEGLGVGKSLFGLLDRVLLLHARATPGETYLLQGPKGPLQLQVEVLADQGLLLLLKATFQAGALGSEALHQLKNKVAGATAVVEILEREAEPGVKPLLELACANLAEIAKLVETLHPPPPGEIVARDFIRLLTARLEERLSVAPGAELAEEVAGWLVQVDTFALTEGLIATLADEEGLWLQGEGQGSLFRLSILFPQQAPEPSPLLREAVEAANGSLWREQGRLVLLLCARPAPLSPAPKGVAPRALVFDLTLFRVPQELEAAELTQLLYSALDLETTGLDPERDAIVAIGSVRIVGGRVLEQERYEALVKPARPIPQSATDIHGLTWEMLHDKPPLTEVLPTFQAFLQGTLLVAHNGAFDVAFLRREGLDPPPLLDTLLLAQLLFPDLKDYNLELLAERFGVPVIGRHTALGDALMTAEIFTRMLPLLQAKGFSRLGEVVSACRKLPLAKVTY
jgi:DNA polymerase-3 subunit epsilon